MNTAAPLRAVPAAALPYAQSATRPLLFLHIPKTAGTSFLSVLHNVYGDDRVLRLEGDYAALPGAVAAAMAAPPGRWGCLAGHVPLHVWRPYLDRLRPFTFLRDPVARVFSLYRFFRRAPAHELATLGLSQGFDFEEFITTRAPGVFGQVSNGMTRMLSGMAELDNPQHADFRSPEAMARGLTAALGFLEGIEFGLVERMGPSLAVARRAMGTPMALDEYAENATERTGAEETIGNIARVVALNAADIALYHAAALLFARRLAAMDSSTVEAGIDTLWRPVPGRPASIADIPGRQGFHKFEQAGFAWLMAGQQPRFTFLAPAAPARIVLKVYRLTEGFDIAGTTVRLNGTPLPVEVTAEKGHWATLATAQTGFQPGVNTLAIEPLYSVPVRFLNPGSLDRRDLSFALATVEFR